MHDAQHTNLSLPVSPHLREPILSPFCPRLTHLARPVAAAAAAVTKPENQRVPAVPKTLAKKRPWTLPLTTGWNSAGGLGEGGGGLGGAGGARAVLLGESLGVSDSCCHSTSSAAPWVEVAAVGGGSS